MAGLFDLSGKVAVVTGSSKGIGRAIAEQLAVAGAKVVVSSRKAPLCDEVVAAIRGAGGEAVAIPCNIGHKDQLQALVDGTLEQWGRLDILVCNAAVNPFYGSLSKIPDDAFDRIMGSNVRSNHWLCQMALPHIAAAGGGSVIIVSSIGGLRGSATLGTYAISKAADFQLGRNLAVEWGARNVTVNCIAPGLVRTDFARALWEDPERLARTLKASPLGRIGEPIDIAGTAVFLASAAARFMTGQVLVADGGVTITGGG
ncbi:MAG TPA: SDR family oxidoreductase [Candidatus Sulfotelmatobacter sp.]|nr:SDR family oxidoreductase [Candidatus Sulfotelmatobacter sp.]